MCTISERTLLCDSLLRTSRQSHILCIFMVTICMSSPRAQEAGMEQLSILQIRPAVTSSYCSPVDTWSCNSMPTTQEFGPSIVISHGTSVEVSCAYPYTFIAALDISLTNNPTWFRAVREYPGTPRPPDGDANPKQRQEHMHKLECVH